MKDLFAALEKTKNKFSLGFKERFQSSGESDESLIENLETLLLSSDVGVTASQRIISDLKGRVRKETLMSQDLISNELKESMINLLEIVEKPLCVGNKSPYVILIIGANGAGKTTTCGKLAKFFKSMGRSVMLASGDTFRAAANEQLIAWGMRNSIEVFESKVIDPAAAAFEAIQASKKKKTDILLIDTAGRLPNNKNLIEELKKIRRVISKAEVQSEEHTWIVIDANTGQNAISQIKQFREAIDISGIILTKFDGTNKAGFLLQLSEKEQIPIRFVGHGEKIIDIVEFSPEIISSGIVGTDPENN